MGRPLRWNRNPLARKRNEDALSRGDGLTEFGGLSWRVCVAGRIGQDWGQILKGLVYPYPVGMGAIEGLRVKQAVARSDLYSGVSRCCVSQGLEMRKGCGDHWLWMLRDGEVRSLTILCSHLSGGWGLLALPGVGVSRSFGFTMRECGGGLAALALDQRQLLACSLENAS